MDVPLQYMVRLRRIVIESNGYKCSKCRLPQRSQGYRDENGEFVDCDELMRSWAEKNGFKVFTVFLTMHRISGEADSLFPSDYAMFCPKCRPRRVANN